MEHLDESGHLTTSEDDLNRTILTGMLSRSERIRGLVQQATAAVLSANAGIQRLCARPAPLPGMGEVIEHHAAASRYLNEAVEGLAQLDRVLQSEIRERTLLHYQLEAAFEQEKGSRKAALHDPLTGLSNRVLFYDRLEHGIAQAARHGWMLAVLFVDLNEFKSINDDHGHQAGDAVLESVALRLTQTTRHEDTVSRHGGDEFLCLLTPLYEQKYIEMIAAKILAAIQLPCEVSGRNGPVNLVVRGSIGISVFPKDGTTAAELIRRADDAMYVAKKNKSGFAFTP